MRTLQAASAFPIQAVVSALLLLVMSPVPQEKEFRILFLGNSHTSTNDVPAMVAGQLRSGGFATKTEMVFGAHLDDLEPMETVREKIDKGGWTHVVLQGAMISSSHKYEYSQEKVVSLAKRVVAAGAVPLYFAEWPRRGWDESDYIVQHYDASRREAGGEIVPVCYAWDSARKGDSGLDMWQADGNHAALSGSFLAACTIAYWIAGPGATLTFAPQGLEPGVASRLRQVANACVTARWTKK
jgi:hypothetical protein